MTLKKDLKLFIINIIFYASIVLIIYYLYSPLNNHPNNQTSSSTQFIYQQF